jgi:hypothetical protein
MPETSDKPEDYKPGARLDPEAQGLDDAERTRRRQERDRVSRQETQGG